MYRGRTVARLGACLLWPLFLVMVLVILTAVDADGDPLTSNFPPIVLETKASVRNCAKVDIRSRGTDDDDPIGRVRISRELKQRIRSLRERRLTTVRLIRGP